MKKQHLDRSPIALTTPTGPDVPFFALALGASKLGELGRVKSCDLKRGRRRKK